MNYMNNNLDEALNDQFERQHLPEKDECELCLNPIPFNAKSYKFNSTNFNKEVLCGCYDCYIFELENKI